MCCMAVRPQVIFDLDGTLTQAHIDFADMRARTGMLARRLPPCSSALSGETTGADKPQPKCMHDAMPWPLPFLQASPLETFSQ